MNRYKGLLARMLLALMLTAASMPGLAVAQEAPRRSELSAEILIETARAALAKGELEDAEFLLGGIKPGEGNIDDLDFLYGSIAMAREDWQTAIARFRAMLIRDPTLPRVRLDLALAYFRAEEDSRAAYHFRQALGDEDLPPVVRARTLAYLDAIRRRKTWSVSTAVALAPDNNINAATSSRQVNLFGFPAQLSEDARQTSGVGLNANISGGYEARISPDLRFRTGASLYTRTYEQSKFNDRTLTLRAGPLAIGGVRAGRVQGAGIEEEDAAGGEFGGQRHVLGRVAAPVVVGFGVARMRHQRLVRARDDAQRPVVGGGIRYREPHRGSLNGVAYLEIEVVLVPVGGRADARRLDEEGVLELVDRRGEELREDRPYLGVKRDRAVQGWWKESGQMSWFCFDST